MPHVVIAGGGISGLAAAHRLTCGAPDLQVTLLEASDRLGGIVRTIREDGFIVEAGPDSFLASKPAGLALCRELSIENRLIGPIAENRGSFVLHDGRLYPIPEGLTGLVPSRLEPMLESDLLSSTAKQRLAQEPHVPPRGGSEDESLAVFVERRFGKEVYERLVEPLMAGIYAGDGTRLSLLATFPQLREMELRHGSILRAVTASTTARPSGPTGFLTPRSGMQEIVDALALTLDSVELGLNRSVRRVQRAGNGWSVSTGDDCYHADAVIMALPPATAAEAVRELDSSMSSELGSIPSASSAIVALAYNESEISRTLRGYGYIIPRAERRPALACTWVSSKWEGRAPAGIALLRVFLGRFGQEGFFDAGDDTLIALAREELWATLGIAAEPSRRWIFRWPGAMPQYLVGHRDLVARISTVLSKWPGLFLAGNAYTGVGLPDCIRGGQEAAAAALAHLDSRLAPARSGTRQPERR
jgi:oxygen-dependent protoporphyrinogen oxidase